MVTVSPAQFGSWLDRSARSCARLTDPLARIFRDEAARETEHALAASILVDHAQDRPDLLAELLLDADPKAYARLFPAAEKQPEKIAPLFQAELAREARPLLERPTARSVLDETRSRTSSD